MAADPSQPPILLRDTWRRPGVRGGVGYYTIWLAKALSRIAAVTVQTQEPAAFPTCDAQADLTFHGPATVKAWRLQRLRRQPPGLAGRWAGVILPHPQEPVVDAPGARLILVLHDLIPLLAGDRRPARQWRWQAPDWRAWFWRRDLRTHLPRLVRQVDRVVVPSAWSKQDVVQHLGVEPARIAVIPNGYNPHLVALPRELPARLRGAATAGEGYVVQVANGSPHKNVARLLQALALLRSGLDLQLVVIGIAPGGRYSALARDLGVADAVWFLGQVSDADLAGVLAHARALVQPSLYEGFGMPPLEAMALGVPVVAARAASLPEVCGDAALYFDPRDPAGMAATIARMVMSADVREAARNAGLVQAGRFGWERTAAALIALCEED